MTIPEKLIKQGAKATGELFRDIEGFEGNYSIDRAGNVKSNRPGSKNTYLKQRLQNLNYKFHTQFNSFTFSLILIN